MTTSGVSYLNPTFLLHISKDITDIATMIKIIIEPNNKIKLINLKLLLKFSSRLGPLMKSIPYKVLL